MPDGLNSPGGLDNGKPRPHPLPQDARHRMSRHRSWFFLLFLIVAVAVVVWNFTPF